MDGSNADHSDSDSGESWTLLERMPTDGNVSVSPENQLAQQRELASNIEKDEDTDGISIISDSDPESSSPCELSYDYTKSLNENLPSEQHAPQYISLSPLNPNNSNHHESVKNDNDILTDSSGKHKTYVHRRNKRLSMVLNIIMLGSVITAAGVAIGHMWGARNDCSLNTTPSVNKILSNLYKLQEENAYLRSKLKELTFANIQMNHKSVTSEKLSHTNKQQRCKKVYEGSINNRNAEQAIKCLDNNVEQILNTPMIQPAYEKDFLSDIDKLKHVYQQNKSWLDEEVAKRMKREVQTSKSLRNMSKNINLNTVEEELVESKDQNTIAQVITTERIKSEIKLLNNTFQNSDSNKQKETKISYADSLKTDHYKKEINENKHKAFDKGVKEFNTKKNKKGDGLDITPQISLSEHEFQKDDRYTAPKTKQDRKKHDRQKSRKKQKRKNKYEQWEMKGGYLKDFDEVSITSSQENEYILKKSNQNFMNNENYFQAQYDDKNLKKIIINDINTFKEKHFKNSKNKKENIKNKDSNWFDKRMASRSEARNKLEQELFEKNTSNNARWYFRRMQKREQCRAKGDNSTYRKQTKRNINYKMKR